MMGNQVNSFFTQDRNPMSTTSSHMLTGEEHQDKKLKELNSSSAIYPKHMSKLLRTTENAHTTTQPKVIKNIHKSCKCLITKQTSHNMFCAKPGHISQCYNTMKNEVKNLSKELQKLVYLKHQSNFNVLIYLG